MKKYLYMCCFFCVAAVLAAITIPIPVAASTGVVAASSSLKRLAGWLIALIILGFIAFLAGRFGKFGGKGGRRRR